MTLDGKVVKVTAKRSLFVDISPSSAEHSPLPTIIFMHGLGSSSTFYEAALANSALTSRYRVVRYDFNGHGLSPMTTLSIAIDSLVQDLKDLLDYLYVDQAAGIVGHSVSGLVATTFAAKYPDRVAKLFLIGPIRAFSPANREVMLERANTAIHSGLSTIVNTIMHAATSTTTKRNSPLSLALIRALVLGTKPEAYAAACRAIAYAVDPDYASITARVLIVGGREDYLSSAAVIAGLCQDIRRGGNNKVDSVEMADVGHWHAVEAPLKLAKLLNSYFM